MPIDRWRWPISVTVLAALLGPSIGSGGTAAKPSTRQPVDMGLLEFLGSADPTSDERQADGGSWMVYLSKLKLGKSAKTAGHASPPASKPAAATGTSGVRSQ